ncbi:MAG: thioredoxin domain-containing protein [Deltaproteobacteria bacterium]|nr:thioredoxin domain-containing protein [Deltaproteobacteria bacterium]
MRPTSHSLLALALLVLSACSGCTTPEAKTPDATPAEQAPEPPSERDKARSELAGGEEIKEARGVSLDKLSDSQKTSFFQIINSEPSACDKPHSIAVSLRDDGSCRDSLVVAQLIADALVQGATVSAIRDALDVVVAGLKPRDIPTKGRPVWGNENAPVTVVVFADFTCPHCRAEVPKLRAAIDQFRGRAKLVFKYFPLQGLGHERSRFAALAAEAAHEQGKFWEMHDQIFEHFGVLEDEDIMGYARAVGLDLDKFRASYEGKKGDARIDADRKDGETLEIGGTPAVFVNGRMMNELLFGGTLPGWIDDALKR